jgi:hypothetical protein
LYVIVDGTGDTDTTVVGEKDGAVAVDKSNGEGVEFKSSIILPWKNDGKYIIPFQSEQKKTTKMEIGITSFRRQSPSLTFRTRDRGHGRTPWLIVPLTAMPHLDLV